MRTLPELLDFLAGGMSMSEVYQPAIILYLLEQGGTAGKADLARVLSGYDEPVQEYYQRILMRWPKITLTKHQIVTYDRKSRTFSLNFGLEDVSLVDRAKAICEEKIREWIVRQAAKSDSPLVEASRRYCVLKAARGKCELCGISAKIAPIEVDHIVPRNKADKQGYILKDGVRMQVNDERNLQALCFRCNRAKRDQDTTDFRPSASKLVRDRIPEIIQGSGRIPVTRRIRDRELKEQLLEKLTEEHAELLADTGVEEVVDMIEVLLSISAALGHTEDETLQFLYEKRAENGSFSEGIVLMDIVTN